MSQKKVLISDYCPYLNKIHTTSATLEKLSFCNDPIDHAKCTGFSCDYHFDCTYDIADCPLYQKARSIDQW